MQTVSNSILEVLTPVVGRPAAKICLTSCTTCLSKPEQELDSIDLPFIAQMIRASLDAFAPPDRLETAISEIRRRCS